MRSMRDLLTQHQPILNAESGADEVISYLGSKPYLLRKNEHSPNSLFTPNAATTSGAAPLENLVMHCSDSTAVALAQQFALLAARRSIFGC